MVELAYVDALSHETGRQTLTKTPSSRIGGRWGASPTSPRPSSSSTREDGLEVYHRPHDPKRPVVCVDETFKQLIGESREPLPPKPGAVERYDHVYTRKGVASLVLAAAPLSGWRHIASQRPSPPQRLGLVHPLAPGGRLSQGRVRRADHGPTQHALARLSLRGVCARQGQAPGRPARGPSHAPARLLADHGRDRAERCFRGSACRAALPARTRWRVRSSAGKPIAMSPPPRSLGSSQPQTPASSCKASTHHLRRDTALEGVFRIVR